MEETAPLKLRSRWSRRASSGGGPRSGVEAGRLDLGSASLESLARELRAHPHNLGAQPVPSLPPAPRGRPARCPRTGCCSASQGEASQPLRRTWSPQRPPTLAPTPQASVDASQPPAGSLGPVPNSQGAAYELGGVRLGEGRRFWPLPVGRRKCAPNRPPPWACGVSSLGERPLEYFSLCFLTLSTRQV